MDAIDAMHGQRLNGPARESRMRPTPTVFWTRLRGLLGRRTLQAGGHRQAETPPVEAAVPPSAAATAAAASARTAGRRPSSPSTSTRDAAATATVTAENPQERQANPDAARWGAALLDQLGVSARR